MKLGSRQMWRLRYSPLRRCRRRSWTCSDVQFAFETALVNLFILTMQLWTLRPPFPSLEIAVTKGPA